MDHALQMPVAAVVLMAALLAAATDILRFRVHNLLTLPLLIAGLVYHGVSGGSADLLNSFAGAILGFAFLIGFYLMGGMGAGDVKLLAALGAWLGVVLTFYVFIASSLAAGVYALAMVLMHRRGGETLTGLQIIWHRLVAIGKHLGADDRIESEVARSDRRGRIIPFAAMVAFGIITTMTMLWLRNGSQP